MAYPIVVEVPCGRNAAWRRECSSQEEHDRMKEQAAREFHLLPPKGRQVEVVHGEHVEIILY